MRIGLVSYRCENRNVDFNMRQIETALKKASGKADVLCFSEAFLQGFDALCWEYDTDREIAVERSSEVFMQLRQWTVQYNTALIVGYIEKDGDKLYSSCAVLSDGEIVHNYRRISKGWKEVSMTDEHYMEGMNTDSFCLLGRKMKLTLCGDLWDYPELFKTDDLLIWPVYVNYSLEEWNAGIIEEYASQAALTASDTLMINCIDDDPLNHGGSFHFHDGKVIDRIPFDKEDILQVDID